MGKDEPDRRGVNRMQVNTRHDFEQQLRDVLHVLATHTETGPCVSLILQTALDIAGAAGAAFRSFGDDALALTVGDSADLDPEVVSRLDFAAFDPSSGALVCPVRDGQALLGVLWLTVDAAYQPDQHERDLLASLTDGLVIVLTRARAQRASEEAQQLSRSLLDSISDPLLVFDEDRRLVLMNPAAERIFNVTLQAAVGKPLGEILQSEDLAAFVEARQPLAEWDRDEQIFVPRVQPVYDGDSHPLGAILGLHDVTRYKKLNRSQNEFLRIVSHDVRSPLTSISGFAAMLGTVGELNQKQDLFVEKILNGVDQITTLVDNIQDAGRFDVETGFYEMRRAPLELRDMVKRIVNNHLVPAEKQELTIAYAVADDVPTLNADVTMIERAISNLVDNAIKYTPNGGKIDVLVSKRDRDVVISVRDNGYGISPENQKQLFQRHFRIPRQEHRKVKGTGLGLFIVKSVAQRHGGNAWIESVENVGSTFSFNIPLKGDNLVSADAG